MVTKQNKALLKEILLNEELKKFKLLSEYSFYTGGLDEADEPAPEDLEPVDSEVDAVAADLGVDDVNATPDQNLGQQPTDDTETGDIPDMNPPAPDSPPATPPTAQPPAGNDVEVDVTELVKSGEDAKNAATSASHKTDSLLAKFGELENRVAAMSSITAKIDDLEREIVKRNPTPVEKLEMRSLDSYPYSIKLTDFWKDKEDEYNVLDKSAPNPNKEYVLTQDDVDADYSEANIKKSFSDYEEEEI